jgi:hypothetical protein
VAEVDPRSGAEGKRGLLATLNDVVKSPLFVFLVGGSFASFYPSIRAFLTPDGEKRAEREAEGDRADAALIAPILANMDFRDPGRYRASRAILQELAEDSLDGPRSVIVRALRAMDSMGIQVMAPPATDARPDDSASDSVVAPSAPVAEGLRANVASGSGSTTLPAPAEATPPADTMVPTQLRNAAVYIQAEGGDSGEVGRAGRMRSSLQRANVLAPAVQALDRKRIPDNSVVRYYHEADRDNAYRLAQLAARRLGRPVAVRKFDNEAAVAGVLELWLGRRR